MNFFLPQHFDLVFPVALLAASFFCASIVIAHRQPRSHRPGTSDGLEELYRRLKEDIRHAVEPRFVDVSTAASEVIELAIEIWRMEQKLAKVLANLPENQRYSMEISIQKLKRFVARQDIELLDYTNQKFNSGLNLDILSTEIDPSVATPIVKETIEPAVMVKGQVIRKAKVVLLGNQ